MKNPPEREEQAIARLLEEAYGSASRPDPRQREAAWNQLQRVFQADQSRGASAQDISVDPARNGEPNATTVAGWRSWFGRKRPQLERNTLMNLFARKSTYGWGVGIAAAVLLGAALLAFPRAQARAAEVMARGARAIASLTSIHLKGQLRTLPADNFSYINPESSFYPIELWKQFTPELKWRAEKPGRVVVMDGKTTIHYIRPSNSGVKLNQAARSAFDTDWLHRIADLSQTISNDLRNAQAKGWPLSLDNPIGTDGRRKAVVSILARTDIPEGDYLRNSFLGDADTRRVYRFDDATERLEGVEIFLIRKGAEVLIFQLTEIQYDETIAPEIWKLNLPDDVQWIEPVQKIENNEVYASMTPEQAARAFFEACARQDWTEAAKFMTLNQDTKDYLGGLKIVSLGQPFTSKAYGGRFVPYEIRLKPMEVYIRMSNDNPARRFVITGSLTRTFEVRDTTVWPTPPAVLPNNAVYEAMSAADAAKAFADAWERLDWETLAIFCPPNEIERSRKQLEEAQKSGVDAKNLMPVFQVGEATWSPEQKAWLVKCTVAYTKKHNLALRKDNPAGRWQVDGGI